MAKNSLYGIYIVFLEGNGMCQMSILAIFLKPSLLKCRSIISWIIFGKLKIGIYIQGLVIFSVFVEEVFVNLARICEIHTKKFMWKFIPVRYLYICWLDGHWLNCPFCNKVNVQFLNWREYCQFHFFLAYVRVF